MTRTSARGREHRMLRRLAPVLAILPLVSGCLVAAVGVTAAVASQEFIDSASVAFLKEDHGVVWEQTKTTLARLSLDPIEIEEEVQAARCNIDGAMVTVHVEIFDVHQTKLAVGARKWAMYNSDAADEVLMTIKKDLDR